ncbi:L-lactate dehydrogenase [Aureobasidium pullulans]|uniref:L-lactate dehydrogenase n=1 Tax=Aureobasidium pullulans TaxID=5580 RepID=A0A4S9DRX9_AURPU|nr:L-lactate dehydrogenase [Aureobasidium pullulans]THX23110.1 L-lactate dehydrogenase [Aureobasidium pullulans]THZ11336.1 L-lactate dehydrogenase [Aureobasidium pullulans]
MSQKSMTSRIAILGSGEVGSTIAYSLILNPVAGEILLVDPKEDVRDAQVQDLSDATFHGNTSTQVRAGTHKEAGQCDIVVITAGAAQKKGESRTDLVGRNLKILGSAIEDMKPFRDDTIILLVSNPVDILTYFAQKFSGLPKNQVFGSGTFLDSARLRGILAEKCGVAASSIDAYVLGEHGDSQMVAWSHASVGGVPLELALPDTSIDKEAIAEDTKKKAAAIMESKGATAFGIGGVAASICKSILFDQCNIRPISHYQKDMDVCISMPVVLGRKGIVRQIPLKLNDGEKKEVQQSAKSLREIIEDVEKEQGKDGK